jgi:hypothetical protein
MALRLQVLGLTEFRRDLKRVDRAFGKELRLVHLEVANVVAEAAKAGAPGRHKQSIKGRATQGAAKVTLLPGRRGDSLIRFMGAKRRTGWYAKVRVFKRQHPEWVGNQWEPGSSAGEPYHVGEPINQAVNHELLDIYADGLMRLAARAFPERV